MIKEKNVYDALVILFFLSKSDRCSFGLEDEVADYFSSGSRAKKNLMKELKRLERRSPTGCHK